MRFKKVLLVIPHYVGSYYKTADLLSGMGYISEALNQAEIENKVFDMRLGFSKRDLFNQINEYKPDLIGFSMMTFGYLNNYSLFRGIKNKFKNISIVIGGPHISILRERVLQDCPEIDYGITLEGEETIVELCQDKIPPSEIKGLIFRENNKIAYNGDRHWINDLDRIGFPKYSRFEMNKYDCSIPISTSRGCPHQCIYCPVSRAIGGKMRMRSTESVVNEIEYWHNRGFNSFGITDDNFTFIPQRVHEICQEIKKRKIDGLVFSCGNGIRADKVDRQLLGEMKDIGFKYIAFGVESGSEHILKIIKKGESLKDIEKAIKDACDIGLSVILFFLLGSPGETKEDLQRSLDLALKYPVFDARFYNIIPFPNTELFEWVVKNNYLVRDVTEYLNSGSHWVNKPIFATPELSLRERRKLYFQLNRKVKIHTLTVKRNFHLASVKKKILGIGLPNWLSTILANLYYSKPFQLYIIESSLIYNLKKQVKNNLVFKNDWNKNLRRDISSFLRYTGISKPIYKLRSLRQKKELNNEYTKLLNTGEVNNWIKVEFFLTLKCNLNCPMCHQGFYRNRVYDSSAKKEMSLAEVKKCIDNLYNFGIRRIWLMGGEIFLRQDIFQILDYFKYKGILIDIGTNGTLFDKQSIDRLDNYHNINWVELSLDGLESTHNRIRQNEDAFSKTIEAIKLISSKRHFSTTVTFVLQKDNIDELKPTVDLCRKLGVREFNITMRMFYPVGDLESSSLIVGISPEQLSVGVGSNRQEEYPYSKFKEVLDLIPKLNKGRMRVSLFPAIANKFPQEFWGGNVLSKSGRPFCGSAKLIVVDYTGDILLCGFIKKSFGNLLNQPLADIINSADFRAFRKQLFKNHLLPICQRCCALINLS